MIDSLAVRHIATGFAGDMVAAGAFEKRVSVWDLSTGSQTARFETVLSFGGTRLAISPPLGACLAGAYQVQGVACYDLCDGKLRWQRRDLKKIQQITVSPDGESAFCCLEGRGCQVVSVADGRTRDTMRGVRWLWIDPFRGERFEQARRLRVVDAGGNVLFRVAGEYRSPLSASFAGEHVAFSECGGPVHILSRTDGAEVHRHTPPPGHHVLDVAALDERPVFHGIQWCYQKAGPKTLVRIREGVKEAVVVRDLGEPGEHVFCRRGTQLLTSNGELVDCRTGETVLRLPFPPKE